MKLKTFQALWIAFLLRLVGWIFVVYCTFLRVDKGRTILLWGREGGWFGGSMNFFKPWYSLGIFFLGSLYTYAWDFFSTWTLTCVNIYFGSGCVHEFFGCKYILFQITLFPDPPKHKWSTKYVFLLFPRFQWLHALLLSRAWQRLQAYVGFPRLLTPGYIFWLFPRFPTVTRSYFSRGACHNDQWSVLC